MKMGVVINESTRVKGEGLEKAGSIFRVEMGKCRKFILGRLIALTLTRGIDSEHSLTMSRPCPEQALDHGIDFY